MNGHDETTHEVCETVRDTAGDGHPDVSHVPFCIRCHRISSHRQESCCWCGAPELVMFTFDDISAHFKELIGDWIVAGKQAESV